MSDFAQIMLAEMRNYTSRKVIYAFNYSYTSSLRPHRLVALKAS